MPQKSVQHIVFKSKKWLFFASFFIFFVFTILFTTFVSYTCFNVLFMTDMFGNVSSGMTLLQKAEFCVVLILSFSMPITWRISAISLIMWLLMSFIRVFVEKKKTTMFMIKRRRWWFLLFAMYYVMHCVSMLYTENIPEGWDALEKKLSFLVLPFMFLVFDFSYLNCKNVSKLLWAYVLGVLAVVSCDLFSAAWDVAFRGVDVSRFFDISLSSEHHAYVSMHICLGIIVCFVELVLNAKGGKLLVTILLALVVVLFTVATVLLSSRAGLLCMVAVYIFLFLWMIFGQKMYRTGLVTAIVALVAVGVAVFALPNAVSRVADTVKSVTSSEKNEDVRVTILRSTLPVACDNWLTGVGVGDKIDAYMEQYRKDNNQIPLEREYNSHNQFVDTMAVTGILGLVLMLCFFVVPAVLAIRDRRFDVVFALFLFVIFFNALFESVFEKQAGIMFFVFFFVIMFNGNFVAEKETISPKASDKDSE